MERKRVSSAITRLTDRELHHRVVAAAARERAVTAKLITLLAEFDRRQLYLAEGYNSLFAFCTEALHFSEPAAYNRIQAARAARKWPSVVAHLRGGYISLGALGILAPHLTDANCDDFLAEARHRSKRDVERIVARVRPRPDAPSIIRRLSSVAHTASHAIETTGSLIAHPLVPPGALSKEADARSADASGPSAVPQSPSVHTSDAPPGVGAPSLAAPPTLAAPSLAAAPSLDAPPSLTAHPPLTALPPPKPAVIAALSPDRYKVQFTVDGETHDLLREAQDLMRHSVPNGDPAVIVGRALRLLVDTLLRDKAAITSRMARPRSVAHGSRTIPAHVRREVWRRDKGQCAFVGPRGRCEARAFIEYHHVVPFARGGAATVDNIELRCRAHNSHEAQLAGLARQAQARASPR